MSTAVVTETLTVTQADVMYVAQQIKRDLVALRDAYPRLLTVESILELHDDITTFFINDAIRTVGFSLVEGDSGGVVHHELRYPIEYGDPVTRRGSGGKPVQARRLPRSCRFVPWVIWSERMLSLTDSEQDQIVSSTGWSRPGTHRIDLRYPPGSTAARGEYASGVLRTRPVEYYSR